MLQFGMKANEQTLEINPDGTLRSDFHETNTRFVKDFLRKKLHITIHKVEANINGKVQYKFYNINGNTVKWVIMNPWHNANIDNKCMNFLCDDQ